MKGKYETWHAQQPYPVALSALQELGQAIPEAGFTEDQLDVDGFPKSGGDGYVFRVRDEAGNAVAEIELSATGYDIFRKPLCAVTEVRGRVTAEILGSDESSFSVEDHGYSHTWAEPEKQIFPGKVSSAIVTGLFTDLQILPGDGYELVKAQEKRLYLTVPGDGEEDAAIRAAVSEELVRDYAKEEETVTSLEMTEPLFLEENQAVVFTRCQYGSSDSTREGEAGYYVRRSSSGVWNVRGKTQDESSILEYTDEAIFEIPQYAEPPKATAKGHPYYIMVNRQMNTVTIFAKDDRGNYTIPYKAMICSTGREGHETPLGNFSVQRFKAPWCYMIDGSYGQYATGFRDGGYLFHSVCYTAMDHATLMRDEYYMLGDFASAGCVRLQTADAKWIFDNCETGTGVTVYDGPEAGALGKPEKAVEELTDENDNGWDPTDPHPYNPWNSGN
ncbi:MAG: L,D-transpeptidase [Firmicutes bacterium]|nr:L,D-transpeptidase [Bacillota bacterium]